MGKHQHRLAHQCSPGEKISTHIKCEVTHNEDMGMGQYKLIMGGAFMAYNGWDSYDFRVACGLNGWGSYDKVSCCFVWKYAQKMLVFRGVPFPVIT